MRKVRAILVPCCASRRPTTNWTELEAAAPVLGGRLQWEGTLAGAAEAADAAAVRLQPYAASVSSCWQVWGQARHMPARARATMRTP